VKTTPRSNNTMDLFWKQVFS